MRIVQGELLRDTATERHAEDVGARHPKLVEEVRGLPGEPVWADRDQPRW